MLNAIFAKKYSQLLMAQESFVAQNINYCSMIFIEGVILWG